MTWSLPADGSRDRSILVTLARLKKAGRKEWLDTPEVEDLLQRLMPESKRLADALLHANKRKSLSAEEKRDLSYIVQLAAELT